MRSKTVISILLISLAFPGIVAAQPDAENRESAAALVDQLLAESGLEAAVARFQEIHADEPDRYVIDEGEFIRLGYRLLGEIRVAEAVAIFELVTTAFPESWNAWDSLGEAYLHLDDKEQAVRSYERSLELNPESENGQRQLDGMDRILFELRNETRIRYRFQPGEQTGLDGPYLGQTVPGLEPELFAPGLISSRDGFEFSCAFSPDGKQFYCNREFFISVCYWQEDGWTAPQRAEFNNDNLNHEAHITLDGQQLFFGSRREHAGSNGEAEYGIWVMDRTDNGWGEPAYHGPGMYVTTAGNGNLYLTDIFEVAGGGLARARYENGDYLELEKLVGGMNEYPAAHPGIAPDESYLIFDSTRPDALGGEGDDDFYICFRDDHDNWSEPVHLLAGISNEGSNMCAYISPDCEYLFFHGSRDIYWVSTAVLEQFRPGPAADSE